MKLTIAKNGWQMANPEARMIMLAGNHTDEFRLIGLKIRFLAESTKPRLREGPGALEAVSAPGDLFFRSWGAERAIFAPGPARIRGPEGRGAVRRVPGRGKETIRRSEATEGVWGIRPPVCRRRNSYESRTSRSSKGCSRYNPSARILTDKLFTTPIH